MKRKLLGTRVSLLLVGQTFRNRGHSGCMDTVESVRDQVMICASYWNNFILPMESAGASVGVNLFASECGIKLNSIVSNCYENKLNSKSFYNVSHQTIRWIYALTSLDKSKYDFVFHSRNDVKLNVPFTRWPTDNINKILLEHRCFVNEFGCECPTRNERALVDLRKNISSLCVSDKMLWFPIRFYNVVLHVFRHLGDTGHGMIHDFVGHISPSRLGFLFPGLTNPEDEYISFHTRRTAF